MKLSVPGVVSESLCYVVAMPVGYKAVNMVSLPPDVGSRKEFTVSWWASDTPIELAYR